MIPSQVKELLLQALQHEKGGVLVYRTALECVLDDELREEWTGYLEQTLKHVQVLERTCRAAGVDPGELTPGCRVVEHTGKALVVAMKMALAAGDPAAAELVACDCVVLAETKDHMNWQLIGECARGLDTSEDVKAALQTAYDEVEDEEDEHLYHSKGWGRELWIKSLGMNAVLPPPEEEDDAKSAIAAAKAERKAKREHAH
ncbi:MAG: hypothetical protein AB7E79_04855 [Rhodospirillaceae bacterium]